MFDLDPFCEVGILPGNFDTGTAMGSKSFQGGGLTTWPNHHQGIRDFTVEFIERCQGLHLEGIFLAPLSVSEGETHLLCVQYGLHNAVDVDFVTRH